MKKFKRIESYNKKYSKELDEALEQVKPLLIKAFCCVYGFKHKEYIEKTIKGLDLIYFIPEKLLNFYSTFPQHVRAKDKYIVNYYLAYLDYLDFKSDMIKDEEELEKFILKYYIAKSSIDEEDLGWETVLGLEVDNPLYTNCFYDDEIHKTIFLPLFIINLKTIIHEINHALSIDAMGYTEDEIISPNLFEVLECEEMINDLIAELVYLIYIELGGVIPKSLKRFDIVNVYEYFHDYLWPIIDTIGPLIFESLITKNYNLFRRTIGEDNYHKFCELVSGFYDNGVHEDKYIEFLELLEAIKDMQPVSIDYEAYFNELESMGLRVRRLK